LVAVFPGTWISAIGPPNRVVILQFESASAIKKWWEGGLEKLQKEVGHKYADFQTFSVDGVEQK
jgi:hypothetical protein